MHPDDAARLGLVDGGRRRGWRSRVGEIELPVEVTDDDPARRGEPPHGWGHDAEGSRMRVAAEHPGANSNVLTDELVLEPLTGTAVLNGIPVQVAPVVAAAPAAAAAPVA